MKPGTKKLKFVSNARLLTRIIEILRARGRGPVIQIKQVDGAHREREISDGEIFGNIAAAIQLLADRDCYGTKDLRYSYEDMSDIENHKYKRID